MCSPTDVPTRKANKTKISKRVRFGSKLNNQIYHYDAIPNELISELFWSESDHTARHDQVMELAKESVSRNPRMVDSIYLLHGLDYHNKCMINVNQPGFHMYAHMAKLLLASSEIRGMEQCLSSFMEDHMHYSIDRILGCQEEYFTTDWENKCPNLELLLSKCSSHLSVMPCTFAQLIAQGDAIVAAAYQNESFAQQTALSLACPTTQIFVKPTSEKNENNRKAIEEKGNSSDAFCPCPPPPAAAAIVVAPPSSPCSPLSFRKHLVARAMPKPPRQRR